VSVATPRGGLTTPDGAPRVVVTGTGMLTALGAEVASTWAGLVAGRSGIATITAFDPARVSSRLAGTFRWRTMPDSGWSEVFGKSVALRWAIAFFGSMLTEIGGGLAGGCTASLAVSVANAAISPLVSGLEYTRLAAASTVGCPKNAQSYRHRLTSRTAWLGSRLDLLFRQGKRPSCGIGLVDLRTRRRDLAGAPWHQMRPCLNAEYFLDSSACLQAVQRCGFLRAGGAGEGG